MANLPDRHKVLPEWLLVRLNGATGPDREIDADLALLDGWTECPGDNWIGPFGQICVPSYTASVDAALGLIERRLSVHCVAVESSPQSTHSSGNKACASIHLMSGGGSGRVTGKPPALALISALLAALEAANTQTGDQ